MATITSTEAGATGRYINLGTPSAHNNVGAQTVICYCKPTGVSSSTASYILAKTPSASVNGPRFAIVDSGSGPSISFGAHSSGSAALPFRRGVAAGISYNAWQTLEMTWDGGTSVANIHLYVNGTEVTYDANASSGSGAIVADASNDMFLMNRGNSGSLAREFVGDIGYVARWNRELDSTERGLVRTTGPLAVPSGLILCWANDQDYSTGALTAIARSTRVTGSTPPNTSLGGDVALIGCAYTYAQGAVGNSIVVGITGHVYTHSQGALAASSGSSVTLGLTGQSYTVLQGASPVGLTRQVNGQNFTHSQGAIGAVALEASYERSSADLAGSSISGAGDAAIISILPKTQEGESSTPNVAWADPSCNVIGVNAIRPTFRFLSFKNTNGGLHGYTAAWPSTRRPMFSYDDGLTWEYFSNATPDVGNEWIEFRHATAFTQNKIRIAKSRQTTVHQVGEWIAGLATTYSSFFVPTATAASYTPTVDVSGFAAQSFIADEFSPQIDSLGATIPAMPFYAAEINDTSLMPVSGLPKRFATISNGVHSGENISVPGFRALVSFLCGNSAEAQNIRRNYRILIYPCMNAPGIAGGGVRGSWTQGVGGVDDPSRNFSSYGTGLEVVDIPRTCMDADRGAVIPDWFLDLHGMYAHLAGYAQAIYIDDSYGLTERFRVLVSSIGGVNVPVMAEAIPTGAVSRYFKNQGVRMAVSLEQSDAVPVTDASLVIHGESLAKAISSMIDEGAFFTVLAGAAYSYTQGTLNASVGSGAAVELTGQSYTLSQGSVSRNVALIPTGQSYSVSQGSFSVSVGNNVSVPVTGQVYSFSGGSLGSGFSVSASGTAYSISQGVPARSVAISLSGQGYTLTQGLLSPGVSSGAVVALTGQAYSVSQGQLSKVLSKSLVGVASTISQGTLGVFGAPVVVPIVGQVFTHSQGTLSVSGVPVWPMPADVRYGVVFGPNGDDYTGTLVVGSGGGISVTVNQTKARSFYKGNTVFVVHETSRRIFN